MYIILVRCTQLAKTSLDEILRISPLNFLFYVFNISYVPEKEAESRVTQLAKLSISQYGQNSQLPFICFEFVIVMVAYLSLIHI